MVAIILAVDNYIPISAEALTRQKQSYVNRGGKLLKLAVLTSGTWTLSQECETSTSKGSINIQSLNVISNSTLIVLFIVIMKKITLRRHFTLLIQKKYKYVKKFIHVNNGDHWTRYNTHLPFSEKLLPRQLFCNKFSISYNNTKAQLHTTLCYSTIKLFTF